MGVLLILLSLASLTAAICPDGYAYHPEPRKCYKLFENALTFFAASDACHEDGATLASIYNASENTYIANLTVNDQREHWIGLTNLIHGDNYTWLDKTPLNYTNWAPSEPKTEESCVLMRNGTGSWISRGCHHFLPFICQYDPTTEHRNCHSLNCPACPTEPSNHLASSGKVTNSSPPLSSKCDDGWKFFEHTGFCYFVGPENVTNKEAQNLCKNRASHLASIHSIIENAFITEYAGVKRPYSMATAWIGLYRTGPNATDFANYDGTLVNYTNWEILRQSQPDNMNNNELCTMIYFNNILGGFWNDITCDHLVSYICKKPSSWLP